MIHKRILSAIAVAAMTFAVHADDTVPSNAELLKLIGQLQSQLQQQATEIQSLKEQLANQAEGTEETVGILRQEIEKQNIDQEARVERLVREEVDAFAQEKSMGPELKFAKHLERLKFKNDLRMRWETIRRDSGTASSVQRDRVRYRLRLGTTYTVPDWELGVQLASGDGGGATSTNETLGDNFARDEIRIDRAYAKYKGMDNASLTLGKMKNPFAKNQLIWDSDLNPEGVALSVGDAVYARTAYFLLRDDGFDAANGSGDANSQMYGAQVGWDMDNEDMSFALGAGYYRFNHATVRDSLGIADSDYELEIGELYTNLGFDLGDVGVDIFGKYIRNFGADGALGVTQTGVGTEMAEDNDTGWLAGFKVGMGKFSLKYFYEHLEGDANWGALDDSDFGSNRKGHEIIAEYKIRKDLKLAIDYIDTQEIEGTSVDTQTIEVDLIWKF